MNRSRVLADLAPPSGWDAVPAGAVLTPVTRTGYPDEQLLSVSKYRGVHVRESGDSHSRPSEDLSHYLLTMPGDLVVNIMLAWDRGLGVSTERGLVSPAYATYTVDEGRVDSRFLNYQVRSEPAIAEWRRRSYGIQPSRWRLYWERMSSAKLPLPPLDTQRRIADMLDAETARIDTLIAKNQRALELLDLRFWSWAESVTHRGLAKATSTNSHAVWGEHPSHWSITTLGRAAESMVDGPFGSSLTSAHYSDTGRQVIRLGNIGRGQFKNEARAFIPEDHYKALSSHEVRSGDLVMGGLGDEASDAPVGRACVVPEGFGSGIVKADCYRIRLLRHLEHEFAAWALSSRSQLAYAASKARGATRPRLNLQLASELPLPVPPLTEQRAIVSEIADRVDQSREIRAKVDRQQELLRLRRRALITAAVTGEIDV